jgi:hypothetical protein
MGLEAIWGLLYNSMLFDITYHCHVVHSFPLFEMQICVLNEKRVSLELSAEHAWSTICHC